MRSWIQSSIDRWLYGKYRTRRWRTVRITGHEITRQRPYNFWSTAGFVRFVVLMKSNDRRMSHERTVLQVAADWHELVVPRRIMRSNTISSPNFSTECRKKRLNCGSFVLFCRVLHCLLVCGREPESFVVLYFVLFNFSGLYLVTVACHLSF